MLSTGQVSAECIIIVELRHLIKLTFINRMSNSEFGTQHSRVWLCGITPDRSHKSIFGNV